MVPNLSKANRDAALWALVFFVFAPGMVAGFVPWAISRWRVQDYPGDGLGRPLGAALIVAGLAVLIEAFARFVLQGHGTPSPNFPTRRLIIGGSYRYVRNPMYLAVEAIILGQAALLGRVDLLLYAAIIAVGFYLFVVWAEEPILRRSFPNDYRRYAANVHRWLPRLTPWEPPADEPQRQPPKTPARESRDKRLADALRHNLKRRKAAQPPAKSDGKQSPR
jgi:protein-S-isoprenylcysteine O-methyltransferase Ste14